MEKWRQAEVPAHFQRIVDEFAATGHLLDPASPPSSGCSSSRATPEPGEQSAPALLVEGEEFVVVGACLLMLRIMAQYCNVLAHFRQSAMELLMHVVGLLKQFNSRTCQLILGAGALELVGLKTISVKTLALTVRCLQLISRFIPVLKQDFLAALPAEQANAGRHFDLTLRDYNDHVDEIYNKLVSVVEQHVMVGLNKVRN